MSTSETCITIYKYENYRSLKYGMFGYRPKLLPL
uniref:Uncharacterized protein n=1 Tax=Arundo donax TaxID=35708 RepID=A0A0A9G9H7_ARUDO